MEEHFDASKGGKEPTFYSLDRTTTTRLLCSIDVEKFLVMGLMPKILRLFEFDYQNMNRFEFIQFSKK